MKIDYFRLLRESIEFTWKYKVLWVFGFILTFFSGGSSDTSSSRSDIKYVGDGPAEVPIFDKIGTWINDILESPYLAIVILIVIALILILVVISWYLTRVSKLALIDAVYCDKLGREDKIKLTTLWKGAHPFLGRFFAYDLVWLVLIIITLIAFVLTIVILQVLFGAVGGSCCGAFLVFVFILFLIVGIAIRETGIRIMALENSGVRDSLKRGWKIVNGNFSKYFFAGLTMLVPGCLFIIVIVGISVLGVFPLLLSVSELIKEEETFLFGIGVGGVGCCMLALILAAIVSPYKVFVETYWTKFMMLLLDSNGESDSRRESTQS